MRGDDIRRDRQYQLGLENYRFAQPPHPLHAARSNLCSSPARDTDASATEASHAVDACHIWWHGGRFGCCLVVGSDRSDFFEYPEGLHEKVNGK